MELTYDKSVGMGLYAEVWRATDVIGRVVAVKFFQNAGSREEKYALTHAAVLARVKHPSVVQLFAVESQPHPETDTPQTAIIMEYIDGASLEKTQNLPMDATEALGLDMIRAVAAIHRHGAVHGDLHSGNVMIADGRATLIDMLYTHSLAEVGTRLANANREQDIRELVRLLHLALSRTPAAVQFSSRIAALLVQPPNTLTELEAAWTSLFQRRSPALDQRTDTIRMVGHTAQHAGQPSRTADLRVPRPPTDSTGTRTTALLTANELDADLIRSRYDSRAWQRVSADEDRLNRELHEATSLTGELHTLAGMAENPQERAMFISQIGNVARRISELTARRDAAKSLRSSIEHSIDSATFSVSLDRQLDTEASDR